MRRLTGLLLAGVACAQASQPPGGPPDEDPPTVVRLRPDSNARNVRGSAVTFDFSEVVSERPQGAADLASIFLISPSEGPAQIGWHRRRITVSPRGGFRKNTTYSVTLLPGLTDLDGNVDSVGHTIVFATGATIATGEIRGLVFDWVAQRVAGSAYIEAVELPDSTRYLAVADSVGEFTVRHLPPGRFLLRALLDQNRNRKVDPRELYDTTTVTLTDTLRRTMYAFAHDSLGPAITNVTLTDSLTIKVSFDKALDTTLVITPALFAMKGADSAAVRFTGSITQQALQRRQADSARVKTTQDSVKAALVADSLRKADSARVNTQIQRPRGRRPGAPAPAPTPDRETTRRELPKPTIQIPSTDIYLTLETILPPNASYRVKAEQVRSLLGRERTSERVFRTPKPKEVVDSTKKKQATDSTKKAAVDSTKKKADTTAVRRPQQP